MKRTVTLWLQNGEYRPIEHEFTDLLSMKDELVQLVEDGCWDDESLTWYPPRSILYAQVSPKDLES